MASVSAASRDGGLTKAELAGLAAEFDRVLGIGLADLRPSDLDIKRADVTVSDGEVDALVAQRNQARADRDFARSDGLRDQLVSLGVIVEDQPDGSCTWRWA